MPNKQLFIGFYVLSITLFTGHVYGQQFAGDNQWVAPHGVGTLVATAGQDYAQFYAILAFLPEWEFNSQFVYYYNDPKTNSEAFINPSFYLKRRLYQNEAETAGYSVLGGVGLFPHHLDYGEITSSFQSWWVMGTATFAFAKNNVLLDILPGATVNLDHKQTNTTAWGFTYSSRLAIYKVIPQSAIVGEVFGTAGQANAPISYRAGVRWESKKWIVALTYSSAFNKSQRAGLELGIMCYTNALFGENRQKNK
ncbi:hypothetical protein KFZ70_03170 [Tamlana fucoidanivorans]|uniref:Uncharacterized protein n=1 Tax=Allotamlana fucoidanivorans TaxID=2583814 RepID=A0A5C4SL38_9FLAO|nr:hypothetical protein [Tamlana fucoidanivorans]TNJ44301.1 hypothetical protein FGF67_09750 [Tamlana fucoidanivorans]